MFKAIAERKNKSDSGVLEIHDNGQLESGSLGRHSHSVHGLITDQGYHNTMELYLLHV